LGDKKLKRELQDKLFKNYPKLFKQKDDDKTVTCMCWGCECGDGWYWLLDQLCDCIQSYLDSNAKHLNLEQIEVVQIKEKFGGLRFYTSYHIDTVEGMIWFAEQMSLNICEICGSTKDVTQSEGWVNTRCKKCKEN